MQGGQAASRIFKRRAGGKNLQVCVHNSAENDLGGLSTCYTYGEEALTAGKGKNDGSGTI